MYNGFQHLGFATNHYLNAFQNLGGVVQVGTDYYMDTILRLDSPGISGSYTLAAKGTKRKWDAIDDMRCLEDGSLLALGLGCSPTSSESRGTSTTACTMSSARETDEESSTDLGLNFCLHLSSEKPSSPKKATVAAMKTKEMEPEFDLQLSLSTGPSESEITTCTPSSTEQQSTIEASLMLGMVPVGDEGSASPYWDLGIYSPPLHVAKPGSISCQINSKTDQIPVALVLSSTIISTPKSSVTCTSGLTQQRRSFRSKTCQFNGCGKGARGASGFCIAHGGGCRCQKEGCSKGAEGRTVYCKAHGGGRRCQYLGCTKSSEGRTDYCIAHGGGRRCSHEDCSRAARGKSGLCIRHGGGKRCQKENCTKSAEGFSGLCISHGGGRRCQFPACSKGAQGSTMFCKAHGGGKRCTVVGCTKGAEGSTPFCKGHGGGKRCSFEAGCPKSVHGGTRFCVAHGGGKRCAVPECTKSARGRTDFCVRHGGGKRCKHNGCGKSAQGSTNFCKAHGGGKRCSWGQSRSGISSQTPCERFARGRTGLCAAHNALVQDQRVHGAGTLGDTVEDPKPCEVEEINETAIEEMNIDFSRTVKDGENSESSNSSYPKRCLNPAASIQMQEQDYSPVGSAVSHPNAVSLPEGRVHGGILMAMLSNGV